MIDGELQHRAADLLGVPAASLTPILGGGNNRSYRVDTEQGPAFLKAYFRDPADPRDRLGAEFAFSRFAWDQGMRALPRPLAADAELGIGLYEYVVGDPLLPAEVGSAEVAAAASFAAELAEHSRRCPGARLPDASEARFTIEEHLEIVGRRVERLRALEPADDVGSDCRAWVEGSLVPAWEAIRARTVRGGLDSELPGGARVISPSDFGFHNALRQADGDIVFVDFEYAGWDDPAKLVCDFFCQPAVPVPEEHRPSFTGAALAPLDNAAAWRARIEGLLPAYQVKWCCILLNDFLPSGRMRRDFAQGPRPAGRRRDQLRRAAAALDRALQSEA